MRTIPTLGIALSMTLVALAGCLGGGAFEEPSDDPATGPATFDESSGGIEGIVTDDESMPIRGAQVGLQGLTLLSTTSAEGRFVLSNVPAGSQVLLVQALGYQSVAQRVTVEAGQVQRIDILLNPIPVAGPHVVSYEVVGSMSYGASWKLTPECIYDPLTSIHPLVKTCGGVRGGGSNGEIGLGSSGAPTGAGDVQPDWATIMVELVWQQQTPVFGGSLQLDVLFPNITRDPNTGGANQADPRYFQDEQYSSPIQLRIDRETLYEREIPEDDHYGNVRARVFTAAADLGTWEVGPDVGVMLEQTFRYWVSIAYIDPLDETYTALPDA